MAVVTTQTRQTLSVTPEQPGPSLFMLKCTGITTASDNAYTFAIPFKSAPDILSAVLYDEQAAGATVTRNVSIKAVTATSITISLGGAVVSIANAQVNVLVAGELAY